MGKRSVHHRGLQPDWGLGMGALARARGFTLQELVVTMATVAVVVTTGVPAFQALIQETRLTVRTNELVATLRIARSEAVTRGMRVTVCKADIRRPDPVCVRDGGYQQGWIVFVDSTNPAWRDPDEPLLRVFEGYPGGDIAITGNGKLAEYISFTADGFPRLDNGGFLAGTLTLCQHPRARRIILSRPGRVRTEADAACPERAP